MSSNLNYKQVANVARRTWDLETYEQRAKERAENEDETNGKKQKRKKDRSSADVAANTLGPEDETGDDQKEEFQRAAKGAAGPAKSERAFLKARRSKVDVDSKIGSVEIVNPEAAATTKAHVGEPGSIKDGVTKTGVGWHCRVCDCFLRDSLTYLDHINGRKHQRNLGFSMRVERSTKDQVSSRLAMLAKEKEAKKLSIGVNLTEESFHDAVKAKDEEARRRKEERAQQRQERKKLKKEKANPSLEEEPKERAEQEENQDELEEGGGIDPNLAAMMGFSGFGGGNKST